MAKSKEFKVKGFSYSTKTDMDVINHIQEQSHQARYIIDLIRKDISESKDNSIEEIVEKYVDKLLKDKNVQIENKKEGNISKDSVADLLNMFTT